jgi:hypothetical protein
MGFVLGGCHKDSDSDKRSGAMPVEEPSLPTEPAAPLISTTKEDKSNQVMTDEDRCKLKGDDFEFINDVCSEKANHIQTGELRINEGIIWQPSPENCTKLYSDSVTNVVYYRTCLGAKLTIPLPVPQSGAHKIRIRLTYMCNTILNFPVSIKAGEIDAWVAARNDDTDVLDAIVETVAGLTSSIDLNFTPDYNTVAGAGKMHFPSTCKIALKPLQIL